MNTMLTADEIGDRAEEIFETTIKPLVAAVHPDDFLAIDVISGDFEVDADDLAPGDRLRQRHPDAVVYLRRVGDRAAYFMGGGRLS